MTSIVTTNELPTVDFGKYKNKSVIELMQDKNYCDWAIKNGVISSSKRANIYNIIISGNLPNTDSPTPEHNKLQNLFLNKNFRKQIKYLYPKDTEYTIFKYAKSNVEFEAMGNWDVMLKVEFYIYRESESLKEELIQDFNKKEICKDNYIIKKNDKEFMLYAYVNRNYLIEIKTSVGDDYPCILRKMSSQIELTRKTHRPSSDSKYVLLIDKFESKSTNKVDLKRIFRMKGIKVIFFNELNLNEKQILLEKIKYHKKILENYNEQLNNTESKNDIFIEDK